MIITLDGQSATGKSTLAFELSKRLKFNYLNSGMIFRSITYFLMSNNILPNDIKSIENCLNEAKFNLKFDNGKQKVIINNIDFSPFVNEPSVQNNVSLFSALPCVRKKAVDLQRSFSQDNDIVIEGRDVGSVVFPNAEYKFYIQCDLNVRAKRRLDDLLRIGQKTTLEAVKISLLNRDKLDSTRKHSPLIRPKDAIDIDTTKLTIDETIKQMLSYIKRR